MPDDSILTVFLHLHNKPDMLKSNSTEVIMTKKLPKGLKIRSYRETDRAYIASTFLHTVHDISLFAGTPDRLYFPTMQLLFDTVMRHKNAVVAVVCDDEDPDVIRAWLMAWLLDDSVVIWYSHTSSRYRRRGICSHLIETLNRPAKSAVFTSKIGHRIIQKHKLVRYPTLMMEVLR